MLLAVEVALRIAARLDRRGGPPIAAPHALPRGARVALGEILQPSSERRIVYELRAHLDVTFQGARLSTDGQGFRRTGPEGPGAAAVRIVGLGDSFMFGWGVSDEETYLARLEARLRERFPSRSWQVVNTAVPGYNTAMEVETLARKALGLEPRIVVLEIVGNDLDLPNFLRAAPPVWSLRRSFLFEFVARRLQGARPGGPPSADDEATLVAAPEVEAEGARHFEDDPARAPAAYADLVGRAAFDRSLRELARLRDERGFAVIVLSEAPGFDWLQHFSRRRSRELGFLYLDVGRVIRRRVSEQGVADYQDSTLALGPQDPHPSALGHDLASEEIFRFLAEQGLVGDQAPSGSRAPR